jgi:hypothetical protein
MIYMNVFVSVSDTVSVSGLSVCFRPCLICLSQPVQAHQMACIYLQLMSLAVTVSVPVSASVLHRMALRQRGLRRWTARQNHGKTL